MAVEGADVKDESLAGPHVHGCVAIPAVSVNKAWFENPPIRLEGQEQPGYYFANGQPGYDVELGPLQNGGGKLNYVAKVTGEHRTPRIVPLVDSLNNLRVAGSDVESEFARWRNGATMKICKPGCQLHRFCGLF